MTQQTMTHSPVNNQSLSHFRQLGCEPQKPISKREIPEFVPSIPCGSPGLTSSAPKTLTPADAVEGLLNLLGAPSASASTAVVPPYLAQIPLGQLKSPAVEPSQPTHTYSSSSGRLTPPSAVPHMYQSHLAPQSHFQPHTQLSQSSHQQPSHQPSLQQGQVQQNWPVHTQAQSWNGPYNPPQFSQMPPATPTQRPSSGTHQPHQPHSFRHVPPRLQHLQNRYIPRQQQQQQLQPQHHQQPSRPESSKYRAPPHPLNQQPPARYAPMQAPPTQPYYVTYNWPPQQCL